MIANRSMPTSAVIPVLSYPDVEAASRWLCHVFGFEQRLIIGNHRHQLGFGDGAVVVTGSKKGEPIPEQAGSPLAVMVRVTDVDTHHKRAARHGAVILSPPDTFPMASANIPAATSPATTGRSLSRSPTSRLRIGVVWRSAIEQSSE